MRRPWRPRSSRCEHAVHGARVEIPSCTTQSTVCRCQHLHDYALSTTVHGVQHDLMALLPPSRRCVWRIASTLCFTFLYLLLLVLSSPVYFGVLNICHKDGAVCSFGQGTTSGLPYIRKGSVEEALIWVKFSSQLVSHFRVSWW